MSDLPDIQLTQPKIKRSIKKVGVKNIEIPLILESKFGGFHDITAKVSMYGNLDENTKGISMSRFIQTLMPYLRKPLKFFLLKEILVTLRDNLEVKNSYIKFEFKIPIVKRTPISQIDFPIYYNCSFQGQLVDNTFRFFQSVIVQYASYCPCSAELCKDLNEKENTGFPHNQRSFAHVLIETIEAGTVWIEDIIESVESGVKNLIYPLLKRSDEQEIARIASNNPMFVEDSIRAISDSLDKNINIYDWYVSVEHEESIHPSNAVAINFKGIIDGFDEKINL